MRTIQYSYTASNQLNYFVTDRQHLSGFYFNKTIWVVIFYATIPQVKNGLGGLKRILFGGRSECRSGTEAK